MPPKKINEDELVLRIEELMDEKFESFGKTVSADINAMKDKIIENLMDKNKHMYEKIIFLEDKLIKVERDLHMGAQYSRRNNMEIQGIPDYISDNVLEETVINILEAVDVNVDARMIEACHRLPSNSGPKPTILKFVNRKDCEAALKNKKKLAKIDKEKIGLPKDAQLYFNNNLCPFYRRLAWKCRKLKRTTNIMSCWNENGIVHLRINEGDKYMKITHDSDLDELFPDFEY